MKKLAVIILLVATAGRTRARHERERASARQLHDQPVQPDRAVRKPPVRPLRPRPGRDPDLPGEAAGRGRGRRRYATRLARTIGRHLELTVDGRRSDAHPDPPGARLPARPGGPSHDASRGRLPWPRARRARAGSPTATPTTPAGSAGRRSPSQPKAGARSSPPAFPPSRSARSSSPTRRTSCRARSTSSRPGLGVEPGSSAGAPPGLLPRNVLEQRAGVRAVADGGFASLIARDHLTPGFVALSLLIAMFWGAAHALSPGHGKSIVAAYLVGSRGTPRHAVFLGLTVTATHTIGVFALGLVTLSLSAFIVPDQLYPWLNLVSALLIVGVGVSVLRWRVREWRGRGGHEPRPRPLARPRPRPPHDHEHDHALSHRRLLGIGISGGIVPCPTALVVLLAAISLHRVGLRARPDPRLQRRARGGDDGHRPRRRHREEDVRAGRLQRRRRSDSSPRSARSSCSASAWR